MRPVAAGLTHRAHLSAIVLAAGIFVAACGGGTVAPPRHVQVRAEDYVAVPFSPRPPPVEIVPKRPSHAGDLVWADGGWEWGGDRFRWEPGAWVVAPRGAKRARWVIVRRPVDGQLFFAPSSWRDAAGKVIAAPKALARASTRPGERGRGPEGEAVEPGGGQGDLDE